MMERVALALGLGAASGVLAINIARNTKHRHFVSCEKKKNQQIFVWGHKRAIPGGSPCDIVCPKVSKWFEDQALRWRAIHFGVNFGVAVSETNELYIWGSLEEEHTAEWSKAKTVFVAPFRLKFKSGVVDAQCTANQLYALTTDGEVYVWDDIDDLLYSQLSQSSPDVSSPISLPQPSASSSDNGKANTEVSAASTGATPSASSVSDPVKSPATSPEPSTPRKLDLPTSRSWFRRANMVKQLATGEKHACFLMGDGSLYCNGDNEYGQCGVQPKRSEETHLVKLSKIDFANTDAGKIVKVACGDHHTMALDEHGNVYGIGDDSKIQLGLGDTRSALGAKVGGSWKDRLEKGLVPSPSVVSYNYHERHLQWRPQKLLPLRGGKGAWEPGPNPTDLACGGSFTLLRYQNCPDWMQDDLKTNVLMCAGENMLGQCGRTLNQHQQTLAPTKLPSTSFVETFSCGTNHCLALLRSGDVFGWGSNKYGQIGVGNLGIVHPPRRVSLNPASSQKTPIPEVVNVSPESVNPATGENTRKLPPPLSAYTTDAQKGSIKKVSCDFHNSAMIVETAE